MDFRIAGTSCGSRITGALGIVITWRGRGEGILHVIVHAYRDTFTTCWPGHCDARRPYLAFVCGHAQLIQLTQRRRVCHVHLELTEAVVALLVHLLGPPSAVVAREGHLRRHRMFWKAREEITKRKERVSAMPDLIDQLQPPPPPPTTTTTTLRTRECLPVAQPVNRGLPPLRCARARRRCIARWSCAGIPQTAAAAHARCRPTASSPRCLG